MKRKLAKYKRRLLDIGKRNRLINFKKSVRSTVEIVTDDFYKLYDDFIESSSFEFAKLFENVGDFEGQFEESVDGKLANALGKMVYYKDRYTKEEILEIKTRFKPLKSKKYFYSTTITGKLNNVLNNLSKKGNLYYEENGVNALFISFGLLKYKEEGQEFLAPLALVPIEITQKSISDSFKVKPLDDDFIINDNIVHKFKLDYKIDFSKQEGMELKQYLDFVSNLLKKLHFEVLNEIYIGLFSFSKIMMYQDLVNNENKIINSDVIKTMSGFPSNLNNNITIENLDLDKIESQEEQNQVLPADSSQYKAIYYAKAGLSFVLQGPPGTGKSQTITNMLAELIANNKKVLFVCEKKSALEVVYRNLKKCNLDMYALPLFDTKANKKDIIKSINDNLQSVQNNRVKVSKKAKEDMALDENLMLKLDLYLKEILKKIKPIDLSIYELVSKISSYDNIPHMEFKIENPLTISSEMLDEYLEQIELFANVSKRLGDDPKSHPFYLFSKNKLTKKEEKDFKSLLISAKDTLDKLMLIIKDLKSSFDITIKDIKNIDEIINFTSSIITLKDIDKKYLSIENVGNIYDISVRLEKLYKENKEIKDYLIKKYKLSFLDLDAYEILQELEGYDNKVKRLFGYKKIDEMFESYLLTPKNMKYEEELEDIKKLNHLKQSYIEIKKIDMPLQEYFNEYYFGQLTNFYELNKILYALKVKEEGSKSLDIPSYDDLFDKLHDAKNESYLMLLIEKINRLKPIIEEYIGKLNDYFDYNLKEENPMLLSTKLNTCYIYFDKLYEYIEFISSYQKLDKRISSFKKECLKLNIRPSDYKDAFIKRFYELIVETYLNDNSKLDIYSGVFLNNLLEKYQNIDVKMKEIAKVKIKELVTRSWPELNSVMASNYEVKTLLQEANKKRKLKTLRLLFKEIPNILMDLKPIFMMSPLSVATYLDSDSFHFDCVIFDEASQITFENAIGAMYRADQIIIVGDNEQLPPTSFFDSFEEDEEEEDIVQTYESILDEALISLPKIMLKWHYRSKDETLITFSNKEIYHDLTTFASSNISNLLGLKYEFVSNGTYIHGNRINQEEAKKVVQTVFEIAQKYPDKSLGVVTFNIAQQKYIERLVRHERLKNQQYEDFFSNDKEEQFFIKNLESVQGDERDIIILSTTFGQDEKGKLSLNFGPINKEGGYRRLNVAITRAKESVILVTSLSPDMFNLSKTQNKGVIMLHDYVEFAKNIKSTQFKENKTSNGIIKSISRFLDSKGFKTAINIGYSGYKIDLAVLDPNDQNKIILGILTDGDNYQTLKTIKDRNALIDNVLKLRGWSLYHIWSLPYFKNKELYHNEILNLLTKNKEENIIDYDDSLYHEKDNTESETIESLFMTYPKIDEIIEEALKLNSKEEAILDVIYKLSPIKIADLKKIILPFYGKNRLSIALESEIDKDIEDILFENNLHKVIGFILKPNDLYSVSFRRYDKDLNYYPKIESIYLEELEDGFKKVIKKVKTTSKKILYSEFNLLIGYPKGSSQTKIGFDRIIDILIEKGVIKEENGIIDFIEEF